MTSKSSNNSRSSKSSSSDKQPSSTKSSSGKRRSSTNKNNNQSSSRNIMSPTPYTSTPPSKHTTALTKAVHEDQDESSITNDDLEAMKAMIGDIKKDPSLLYRLSSLSGSPPPDKSVVMAAANNNNINNRGATATTPTNSSPTRNRRVANSPSLSSSLKFNMMADDSTDVSSIGMMSSDDYNSFFHPTPSRSGEQGAIQMGGRKNNTQDEFANAFQQVQVTASTNNNNHNHNNNHPYNDNNNEGGGMPIMGASVVTSPNQSRTNRDAEIALRMQSLRAMRDWNKQQQQPNTQGGRKGSPTNIITATNNSGGGVVNITSPSNNRSRGENNDHHHEDQSQPPVVQSLPSPIQSPQPTNTTTSSSRRREGKSSSSGGGSKSSRSRRKDATTNYHRNVDNNIDEDDNDHHRIDDNDDEDTLNSEDQFDDEEEVGRKMYTPSHNRGKGGGDSSSRGGGGSSILQGSNNHQQQQQDERALRRISEATTETEISNRRGSLTSRSGKQQVAAAAEGGKRGDGSSRSGNRTTRSSRSTSRSSRSSKEGGGGGGRPDYQRSASQGAYISGSQSVHDGHYHHQQQQQQQQPHQSNSRGTKQRSFHGSTPLEPTPSSTQPSDTSRQYGRRNTANDGSSPSKHSFHESSSYSKQYGRRNTTNDESSSPSKHSFHESSSSSLHLTENESRQHRRRNTAAASEQGMYSRSFSYSDDRRIHEGVYDDRGQQQPHQQQQQQQQPQDHPRSQSFSVNEQNNYRGDHSTNSDDRSFQVNQLAKLYARGGTPDKVNADAREDIVNRNGDEAVAPLQLFSSSYEEEGRHRRNDQQQSRKPSSDRRRDDKRYSMNDVSSSAHAELATTIRYSTPQKYSPSDDNLDVNAKAKSVSMIITNRDAEESMSPAKKSTPVRTSRKSKKSSKKSTRGSDEKKHRSKKSKSKVQDAPVSEAEDTLKPLSPSEAIGASLRSSQSSDRASSPEKQSSFHKIRRFPSTGKIVRPRRRASNEFNTSSSSANVMNRLSHPLRSLKSVPSKDSFRGSSQGSSPEYQDDQSESPRRSTLDSTNISDEHDSHAPQKHRKGKLLSRLVTSPTQLDNCGSISIADDDDEHAVSMGIELALMTGDVPRLCDAKGRCLFHPHIRLQKPKLFGGWKILFKHCPDCAVEHMRATQDKLAEKKKKKRREKKSDEKKKSDPIIEMNVGDDGFTPKKNKKKKKKHRDDGEKKEEPQEPLALPAPVPAPEPPREEDYQTDVSDAVTNYDPSYQDSRAIVEHKPPRSKKVNGLPWSDYNGQSGRYTGEVNEQYLPHGRGEMVYDKGLVSAGIWYNGVLDTEEPVSMDGYVPHRLPNYEIGDKGSDEDMIITPKRETAAAVAQIRVNDAAFVRRSDGSWTYAIVKDQVDDGRNRSIRFKVNTRGSTKSFPPSQWGTYIRCVNTRTEVNTNRRSAAQANRSAPGLGEYLDSNNRRPVQPVGHSSSSVAGNFTGYSGDVSVSSTHSAPVLDRSRSTDNLTTAKMRIKSRSRSRGRKNVTTLPLLFSSSMSVSEEAEDDNSAEWETASGSGYRLRGIDP